MKAKPVPMAVDERIELESWLARPTMPSGVVDQARMVLWLADGKSVTEVMELMGTSRPTVNLW